MSHFSSTPQLSVVVPFYGVQDYIGDCLESIRVQQLRDIEVVMVDDGSLDGSREVAQRYVDMDDRFHIITQNNAGSGPARNTGVAHTTGGYLTFVDGDDLIAHQSFQRMVSTLERSGSSFALCNARRFSRTFGVQQSWTHQTICATTQLGTHIFEMPRLIRDRMVWNKVYRRSFWDTNGYKFPAIRYEDYPVTLAAHMAALTVDVLSIHGYYWRERESGDSITQQAFKYDNLLDRVISAELVLDEVDKHGTPNVRTAIHSYLAEIDLVALTQAFAVVPNEDVDKFLSLGHRLANRLDVSLQNSPRFDQIQYAALRANDVTLLRELAQFRADGGLVGGVRATCRRLQPWRFDASFPGRERSTAPSSVYTFPVTALTLRTYVTGVVWEGRILQVTGTAEIDHLATPDDSELSVSLINGIDRHLLPLERFVTLDQHANRSKVGFSVTVDFDNIATNGPLLWPIRFEIDLRVEKLRRVGLLKGLCEGSPTFPCGIWLRPGERVTPGRANGDILTVRRELNPAVLNNVDVLPGGLRLSGYLPEHCSRVALRVDRPAAVGMIQVPCKVIENGAASRYTVLLDPAAVIADDMPDDPFTLRATRRLTLTTDAGDFTMTWPDYLDDTAVLVGDKLVKLTRTPYGLATLTHGPPTPAAIDVQAHDGSVMARGRWWRPRRPSVMTWRRYLTNSDNHIDVPTDLRVDNEGIWSAAALLTDLIPPVKTIPLQLGGPKADWALFVGWAGDEDVVATHPGTAQLLPISLVFQGYDAVVVTHTESIRIQVR